MSRFKELIQNVGQTALAREIKTSQGTIQGWYSGRSVPRPQFAARVVVIAGKKGYPLTFDDIYEGLLAGCSRGKKRGSGKRRRANGSKR